MYSDFLDNFFLPVLSCPPLKISTCHPRKNTCAKTCAVRMEFPLLNCADITDCALMKPTAI